jgi:hypothetical protein
MSSIVGASTQVANEGSFLDSKVVFAGVAIKQVAWLKEYEGGLVGSRQETLCTDCALLRRVMENMPYPLSLYIL